MSRITLLKGLLMNLNQEIQKGRREYLGREATYEMLKTLTGKDFGYDIDAWSNWAVQNQQDELSSP
jgi:hypothetical protein